MLWNPPPSAPAPRRTFFVSPLFSGSSPYFNTIQAAVTACDGVNPSIVFVYPGTYVETVTLKPFVSIVGMDRERCLVTWGTLPGDVFGFTTTAINQDISIANITLRTTGGAGTQSFSVVLSHNGTTVTIRNCTLDAQTTATSALILNNNSGGAQTLLCEDSSLFGGNAGSNGGITMNCASQGVSMKVRRCHITGAEYVYNTSDFAFEWCKFNNCGLKCPDAGFTKSYRHCEFYACTISFGAFNDAQMSFEGCIFRESTVAITGGAAQHVFSHCKFVANATNTTLINITGGTGALKLYGCQLNNGKIVFGAAVTNYLSAIDTIVRNGGAGLAIDSGAFAVIVMLGNFSSDKALGANVTQNAAAYNVNLTVPI